MTANVYQSRPYLTKGRACSFWHQVDEVLTFEPETVLEIGPGPGSAAVWLRQAGVDLTTCDVDTALGADIVADAAAIPVADASFDVVLCSQVLEHLEFDHSRRALKEIRRVARLGAVISVPDLTPWIGLAYPLYFAWVVDQLRTRYPAGRARRLRALLRRELSLRELLFMAAIPDTWGRGGPVWELESNPTPHRMVRLSADDEHKWEIGANGRRFSDLTAAIADAGLNLTREFRVPENPWHHFFVVTPQRAESTNSPSA